MARRGVVDQKKWKRDKPGWAECVSVCVSAHVHQENLAFLKALAPLIFFALPFISFLCLLATYFPEKVIKPLPSHWEVNIMLCDSLSLPPSLSSPWEYTPSKQRSPLKAIMSPEVSSSDLPQSDFQETVPAASYFLNRRVAPWPRSCPWQPFLSRFCLLMLNNCHPLTFSILNLNFYIFYTFICVYIFQYIHTCKLILSKICHGNRQGIVYPAFSVSLKWNSRRKYSFRTKCQKIFLFLHCLPHGQ